MAKFISGTDRNQLVLFPTYMDEMIPTDAEVRLIDIFVEKIDLTSMGIKRVAPNSKGTNHFDPKDLLKLYIYGYRNGIRSSRKLEKACKCNIEALWLMKGLAPDHNTISEFRKDNVDAIKEVFKALIKICGQLDLLGEHNSQDGEKLKAVNSKERNYTLNKIDERIARLEKKVEEYLNGADELDKKEDEAEKNELTLLEKEELERQIDKYNKQLKELKGQRNYMEKSGKTQISLTDPESKLMKNKGDFDVCYNNQVLVNSKNHIVVNYNADNNPADVGTMEKVSKEAKEIMGKEVIINTTDKGYNNREDMAKCLEEGIIPQVTLQEGQDSYEIEFEYEESEITEEERTSKEAEKIKKCLRAGVVPEVYEEYLEFKEVEEHIEKITEAEVETEELSDEELRDFAMENNCFTKTKTGKVFCPQGEILRKKSRLNGTDLCKYCNKQACKNCKNPCTISKYKEVLMHEDQVISTNDKELRKAHKKKKKVVKKVKVKKAVFKLTPKKELISQRMGISEHCHGTMKRTDGFSYFLLKSKRKVNAELALYYVASNLRRVANVLGIPEAIQRISDLELA